MNRLGVALAVVFVLALAGAVQAADLQAGWYVKLGGVALWGWDWQANRYTGVDWDFTGPLGTYGPFEVTQPGPVWPQRMVSVPSAVSGVPPGTAVDLNGQPRSSLTFAVDRLDFAYETYYDATQMRLSLYLQHSDGNADLLYSETRSGLHSTFPEIPFDDWQMLADDRLVFRVTVVPEPSSLLAVLLPTATALCLRRRRPR